MNPELLSLYVSAMYWNNQAQLYINYSGAFKTSDYQYLIDEAQSSLIRIEQEIRDLITKSENNNE